MNSALAAKSRRRLDERFKEIGSSERYAAPVHGWVKAIRQALGMTTAQLARRMGIRQPSVVALEQSEVRGTIELATLRRAAEALDCTLVYVLIPNKPLDATVREPCAVCPTTQECCRMVDALEDQRAAPEDPDAELDEILRRPIAPLLGLSPSDRSLRRTRQRNTAYAEEKQGLIPADITYRSELNEAEQENIYRAQDWALARRRDLLTEKFIKDLHRRMLGTVWRWAGKFRTSERQYRDPHYEVPMALRNCLMTRRRGSSTESYPPDEIAVRFHHRLVQIHPFPNGNGRHARLMANLSNHEPQRRAVFMGSANLQDASDVRSRYIAALQAADKHDIGPLGHSPAHRHA